MKRSIKLSIVLLISIFSLIQSAISDEEAGKIIYLEPKVEILRKGQAKPLEAKLNMILYETDVIKAHKGSEIELELKDFTIIRIDREITIQVQDLLLSRDPQLKIWTETIWKKVQKLIRDKGLEEGSTTLAGVRGIEEKSIKEGELSLGWMGKEIIEDIPSTDDIELMIANLKVIIDEKPEGERSPEALFYLAELYRELSIKTYKKLIETYPGSDFAKEAKEELKWVSEGL